MRIRKGLEGMLVAALLALSGAACAAQNEISKIVLFAPGTPPEVRAAKIEAAGGRVKRQLDLVDGVEAVFPASESAVLAMEKGTPLPAEQGAGGLSEGRDGVSGIESNERENVLEQRAPSFGSFPSVRDFLNRGGAEAPAVGGVLLGAEDAEPVIPWGVTAVKAPDLWARSKGRGVRIGIIDTGIDGEHAALKENYRGGYNAVTEDGAPTDDHGHGTHVAGTVAANSREVIGVAPEASLYSIKSIDSRGQAATADIIKGLEWAVKNKLQVVNMSLRKPHTEALELAVARTLAAGVIIVAAAGNGSGAAVEAPARYAGVIAVSASNADGGLADFSNKGPEVAFIAPGAEVVSTAMGGGVTTKSGTSMAAPHVAGLVALAIGLGHADGASVRRALDGAAAPLPGVTEEGGQGGGMIDAGRIAAPRGGARAR
ncbi:MAG: S8 family serine peptidase [Elusimicrobia bacterium]|nr:S8 family serine peptidase [Elusimicrobiota bacterium]